MDGICSLERPQCETTDFGCLKSPQILLLSWRRLDFPSFLEHPQTHTLECKKKRMKPPNWNLPSTPITHTHTFSHSCTAEALKDSRERNHRVFLYSFPFSTAPSAAARARVRLYPPISKASILCYYCPTYCSSVVHSSRGMF